MMKFVWTVILLAVLVVAFLLFISFIPEIADLRDRVNAWRKREITFPRFFLVFTIVGGVFACGICVYLTSLPPRYRAHVGLYWGKYQPPTIKHYGGANKGK